PTAAAPSEVAAALRRRRVAATLVTSARGLSALVAACDGAERAGLLASQLVVSSARMVQLAEALGFKDPLIAPAPGDRALVDTLIAWARDRMNDEATKTPDTPPLRRDPTTTTVAWAAAIIGSIALAGGIY